MSTNQTSILAYHQIDDLGKRQREVLTVIRELQPCTNLRISQALDLPINSITGRTRELVKKGKVESKGTILVKYQNKTVRVHTWGLK